VQTEPGVRMRDALDDCWILLASGTAWLIISVVVSRMNGTPVSSRLLVLGAFLLLCGLEESPMASVWSSRPLAQGILGAPFALMAWHSRALLPTAAGNGLASDNRC
jgi:hypothetical protein